MFLHMLFDIIKSMHSNMGNTYSMSDSQHEILEFEVIGNIKLMNKFNVLE
jgi:hypothetical protein